MKITPNLRAIIRSGLDDKGIRCVDLTNHLKKPRSWSTKLFNGTLQTLTEDDADEICDYLGVKFIQITEHGRVSDVALRITVLMDADEKLAGIFTSLVNYLEGNNDGLTDTPRPENRVVTDTYRPPASLVTDRKPSGEIETEHGTA